MIILLLIIAIVLSYFAGVKKGAFCAGYYFQASVQHACSEMKVDADQFEGIVVRKYWELTST